MVERKVKHLLAPCTEAASLSVRVLRIRHLTALAALLALIPNINQSAAIAPIGKTVQATNSVQASGAAGSRVHRLERRIKVSAMAAKAMILQPLELKRAIPGTAVNRQKGIPGKAKKQRPFRKLCCCPLDTGTAKLFDQINHFVGFGKVGETSGCIILPDVDVQLAIAFDGNGVCYHGELGS